MEIFNFIQFNSKTKCHILKKYFYLVEHQFSYHSCKYLTFALYYVAELFWLQASAIPLALWNDNRLKSTLLHISKLFDTFNLVSEIDMLLLWLVISLETPVLPVKQWEEHVKLREMVETIRKRQAGKLYLFYYIYIFYILVSSFMLITYEMNRPKKKNKNKENSFMNLVIIS